MLGTCRRCGAKERSREIPTPLSTPSCCDNSFVVASGWRKGHMLLNWCLFSIFSCISKDRTFSLIVPSLETRCKKGENLCFPINMWVMCKLKAGKWSLGAGLYLASCSLIFFCHRDFLNAILCLSKWSLTENICDYCWVVFLLQYDFTTAWQVVTYYIVVTQWNIYVTVATCFKIKKQITYISA